MMKKLSTILTMNCVMLLQTGSSVFAQVVYEKEGGVLRKCTPIAGFKAVEIFDVLNKLEILNSPQGYNVKEGASFTMDNQTNVYKGYHGIGFPRLFKYKGKIEAQGEFFFIEVLTNNWKRLLNTNESAFSDVTSRLNWPAMYTDTFAIQYKEVGGVLVGEVVTDWSRKARILNPRMRPVFVPVRKEQYIKVLIEYLKIETERVDKQIREVTGYMNNPDMKDEMDSYKETINSRKMWRAYYQERKAYYEKLLTSMSAAERAAPAFAADPRVQPLEMHKGKKVDKLTGYMAGELADGIDAWKTWPLFQFNANFFDTRNPRSIQLMVIEETDPTYGEPAFIRRLEEGFFPKVDYKALQDLMLK